MRPVALSLLAIVILCGCGKKEADECVTTCEKSTVSFSFQNNSYEELDSVVLTTYFENGSKTVQSYKIHDPLTFVPTGTAPAQNIPNCIQDMSADDDHEFYMPATGKRYKISDIKWWDATTTNPWACDDKHQSVAGKCRDVIRSYRLNDSLYEFAKPKEGGNIHYPVVIYIR